MTVSLKNTPIWRSRFLLLALSTLLLTSCGSVHYDNVKMNNNQPVASHLSAKEKTSIRELTNALMRLSPSIDPQEAAMVAYDSHVYSMVLANKYKLATPPLYHNMLVNAKKRQRGLCYQWQHDLTTHFKKKHLKTIQLHWAVAFRKNYWKEHNTLVVSAKGKKISDGIVLDPWRNSGELFWIRSPKDKKYPWVKFTY